MTGPSISDQVRCDRVHAELRSQKAHHPPDVAPATLTQEAGAKTADVCRKHGVSEATFYKWKAKFGGLEVSEARRLRQLEDENTRLKKLLADAMLDNAVLKDIASKKW
jgi:putative transposase